MTKKRVLMAVAFTGLVATHGVALASDTGQSLTGSAKDAWLTAKTKIALYADDRIQATGINVDTRGAAVSLRGKVATAEEKRAAEEVARTIDGVTGVRNELQVVPVGNRKAIDARDSDVKNAVERRIKQEGRLKDADIAVRVDSGVVTLMGDVPDITVRAQASEVARAVPGVRSVRNELREKS